MRLSELRKGACAKITKVHAPKVLKDRLASLGVIRGETLHVRGCSIARQTMEIEVGHTLVALRAEEAEKIEVEKT